MTTSRSNHGRPHVSRTERRRAALEQRRHATRKGVAAQVAARRRRSRIRWAAAAVVVAVVGVGAVVLIARGGDDGVPTIELTGEPVEAEGALGITAPLDAYTIDYELTSYTADPANPVSGSEQIRVSRPFASTLTFSDGTGEPSVYTSVLGRRAVTDTGTTTVSVTPAAGALYDWRFDATLDDLVASGTFELKERRRVAERECQVYRTGSPVEGGSVTVATATDYADICIDASGLVLEEVVYLSGNPYQHVVATSVSEDPVDDITVDGEPADTTTAFEEIDAATAPVDGYWTLPTVPEGYELVGRYAFTVPGQTPADDATTSTTAAAEPSPVVSYFDVYRAGGDHLIVQQGPISEQPSATGHTAETTIGALGSATTSVGYDGTMIVANPAAPADWFVAISGSVDLATLTTIAGTLAAS